METPETITVIGKEIAIAWSDGQESFLPMSRLRALSPSAENLGERDLLGKKIGGGDGTGDFSQVTVSGWEQVGGYAIQFRFSDGHNTGIYPFPYLREITDAPST